MAKLTFAGGIHPYDGKDLSKDKPIKEVLPKGDLVYPLSQHIGAPAKPIVQKGDKVLTGQKIAEAGGFVSGHAMPCHAHTCSHEQKLHLSDPLSVTRVKI